MANWLKEVRRASYLGWVLKSKKEFHLRSRGRTFWANGRACAKTTRVVKGPDLTELQE